MPTYAIGDIQGCYDEFRALLELIKFDSAKDQLWLAGDLVNRGPKSLEVLRFCKQLQPQPIVVLGNHDVFSLAVMQGLLAQSKHDTLTPLVEADDITELWDWLRSQKLFHYDASLNACMVHAGIPPQWDIAKTQQLAKEVETVLQNEHCQDFLSVMEGNKPSLWQDDLQGHDRIRCIVNYLTRLRFCDSQGCMELETKTQIGTQPEGFYPWFRMKNRKVTQTTIVFGHWAALGGQLEEANVVGVDTGCVWGRYLSAYCLEEKTWFRIPAIK